MSTAQLLAAAAAGNAAAVTRVLATGDVDVDAREGGGSARTALHVAAGSGHAGVVRALLAAGADPTRRDAAGRTPLGAALFAPEFSRSVADALAGPTLSAQRDRGATSDLGLLPAVVAQLSGIAALDAAALGAANFLLDAGAPADSRDALGHTPLMLAVRRGAAQLPLIKRLLAAGAAPDAMDANGTSVLRHAMSSGSGALVEWLVGSLGEDALAPTEKDFAPFEGAGVISSHAPARGPAPPANHLLAAQPLTPEEEAAARRRARELAAGTAAVGAAVRQHQHRGHDDAGAGGDGIGRVGDFLGWQRSTGGGGSSDAALYRYADRFETFCPGGGSSSKYGGGKGRVACSGGAGGSCDATAGEPADAAPRRHERLTFRSAAAAVDSDAAPPAAVDATPQSLPVVTPDATGDVPLADMPDFLSRMLTWRRRVHALRLRSTVSRAQADELRLKWGLADDDAAAEAASAHGAIAPL